MRYHSQPDIVSYTEYVYNNSNTRIHTYLTSRNCPANPCCIHPHFILLPLVFNTFDRQRQTTLVQQTTNGLTAHKYFCFLFFCKAESSIRRSNLVTNAESTWIYFGLHTEHQRDTLSYPVGSGSRDRGGTRQNEEREACRSEWKVRPAPLLPSMPRLPAVSYQFAASSPLTHCFRDLLVFPKLFSFVGRICAE